MEDFSNIGYEQLVLKNAITFTETYRKYEEAHPAVREAICLSALYPACLTPIQENDLFAGRLLDTLVGHKYSWDNGQIGYYCYSLKINRLINSSSTDSGSARKWKEILEFWKGKTTLDHFKLLESAENYPPEIKNAVFLITEDPEGEQKHFAASYIPRMAEVNLNFDLLLKIGVSGMRLMVETRKQEAELNHEDVSLFDGMLLALDVLVNSIGYYAVHAREKSKKCKDTTRKAELLVMAETLENIQGKAPENLREAIQLFWIYANLANLDNFGRMDVYLGDFLANDLDSGRLSENEAQRLINGLWQLIGSVFPTSGRVIIGGRGRGNEMNANQFALFAMEATRLVRADSPQLSLRFYQRMDPAVYEKAIDVIAEGCTYPMLYNDDIYISAIRKGFGVSQEEAVNYVMSNCGEINLYHRGINSPNGTVNYIKVLELTLFNGYDAVSGTHAGLKTGSFVSFTAFEQLWEAFSKQVGFLLEVVTNQMVNIYAAASQSSPHLFASMLFDDCLKKGKGLIDGARYKGFDVEVYGLISVADSLLAIKKHVFDEKNIAPEKLIEMLYLNFEGYGRERQMLLNAPKFGNDHEEADLMAVRVCNLVDRATMKHAKRLQVDFCLASHINVDGPVKMGKYVGATPDGRFSGQPFSNGNNPLPGRDQNGLTALLNSMIKLTPEITSGQSNQIKLSRKMFAENRPQLMAILDTYFASGGCYLSIGALDKGDLEDALQHPEKHQNLMVRVGGFSARFIALPHELQEDILQRILY
jgi:pyruvate-formate lyase